MSGEATASASASAPAPGATATGLQACAGDVVLLGVVYAATLVTMLPGLWLLLAMAAAGGGQVVELIAIFTVPLILWLAAGWALVSTFRQTLRSGTHIRRRHGRVPERYHALAVISVTMQLVAVTGFVLIFAWAEVVASPLPWVLFLGGVVGTAVAAVVTRVVWHRNGGVGPPSDEREDHLQPVP